MTKVSVVVSIEGKKMFALGVRLEKVSPERRLKAIKFLFNCLIATLRKDFDLLDCPQAEVEQEFEEFQDRCGYCNSDNLEIRLPYGANPTILCTDPFGFHQRRL